MRTNCTKKAYLLSIALLPLFPAKAQFHVGIKAGVTVSNISDNSSNAINKDYRSRVLATGGFFAHLNLGKKFVLRPELVLAGKGTKLKHTSTNPYNNTQYRYINKITFTYLDIPVNLLYVIPIRGKKLLAGGGPAISFFLNNEDYYGTHTTDVGVNLLALYEWPIGFSLGVNYLQGLKNISYTYDNITTKNHYVGFTIGYWF